MLSFVSNRWCRPLRQICFYAVLSCGEVDLFELRDTSFAFPYCGCSLLGEVGIEDFEACVLFSLAVGALSG